MDYFVLVLQDGIGKDSCEIVRYGAMEGELTLEELDDAVFNRYADTRVATVFVDSLSNVRAYDSDGSNFYNSTFKNESQKILYDNDIEYPVYTSVSEIVDTDLDSRVAKVEELSVQALLGRSERFISQIRELDEAKQKKREQFNLDGDDLVVYEMGGKLNEAAFNTVSGFDVSKVLPKSVLDSYKLAEDLTIYPMPPSIATNRNRMWAFVPGTTDEVHGPTEAEILQRVKYRKALSEYNQD